MKKLFNRIFALLGVLLFLGAGNAYADYWLIGEGITWNPSDPDDAYKFTENKNYTGSGKQYFLNLDMLPSGGYKITPRTSNGSWDNTFGAQGDYKNVSNKNTSCWLNRNERSNTNIEVQTDFQNITILFTDFNNGTGEFKIVDRFFLVGDAAYGYGGWNDNPAGKNPEFQYINYSDNKRTYKLENITLYAGSEFKIMESTGSANSWGCSGNSGVITPGSDFTLTEKSNNSKSVIAASKIKVNTLYLNVPDNGNPYLYIDGTVETPKAGVYMVFKNDKFEPQTAYKFDQDNNNEFSWSGSFKKGEYVIKMYDNGPKGGYDGSKSIESKSESFAWLAPVGDEGKGDEITLKVDNDAVITFEYKKEHNNGNNKRSRLRVTNVQIVSSPSEMPEVLYIFGHINNDNWNPKNYVPMTQEESGIYRAYDVDVSGCWSQHDIDVLPDNLKNTRKKNETTGDENYLAFFDAMYNRTGSGNQTVWTPSHKYGALNFHNVTVDPQPEDYTQVEPTGYIEQGESNNYKVAEGIYDIEVNLNNMTVKFIRKDVKQNDEGKEEEVTQVRDYVWYYGDIENDGLANAKPVTDVTDDDHDLDNGHAYHTFVYGDDKADYIQVGVGINPNHRAARQAVYRVWYKAPGIVVEESVEARGAKRLANDDIMEGVTIPAGYTEDTEAQLYHRLEGKDDYFDNTLIQLTHAGDYIVTAEIKANPGYEDEETGEFINDLDNYVINPAAIQVTVAQKEVALAAGADTQIYQPFKNVMNTIFDIALDDTNIAASDITVGFLPDEDSSSPWPRDYTSLGTDLNGEINALTGQNIDGRYKDIIQEQVLINGGNGEFEVTVPNLPCSGVYKMTLTANGNYTLNQTIDVVIYPTVMNVYPENNYVVDGTKHTMTGRFNVNGIPWSEATDGTYNGVINYPIIDGSIFNGDDLENSVIYTPGLYFADIKIYSPQEPAASGVNTLAENSDTGLSDKYRSYELLSPFNLSRLTESNPVELYVYVSKNGAYAPVNSNGNSDTFFQIKVTNDPSAIPTGVDAIGAEDGEAVYFNLQGVQVENPEHGIYVKVQNGKATKVVM